MPDSPVDTPLYRVLENVTATHFPTAIVTPFLLSMVFLYIAVTVGYGPF